MKKLICIMASLFTVALIIGFILFFKLFSPTSNQSTVDEFLDNTDYFADVVTLLSHSQEKIVIERGAEGDYKGTAVEDFFLKLKYKKIIYHSKDYILFIKSSSFGSFSGIQYLVDGKEMFNPNSYSLTHISDHWYFISYWL